MELSHYQLKSFCVMFSSESRVPRYRFRVVFVSFPLSARRAPGSTFPRVVPWRGIWLENWTSNGVGRLARLAGRCPGLDLSGAIQARGRNCNSCKHKSLAEAGKVIA
jgi:hypothetical protein